MNWFVITVLAQIILGTSAVFDKFLLKRKFFDPLVYTFWLGILGIFALLILPFGSIPALNILIIAFVAGAFSVLAMLFLFYALDYSEASTSLPVIGGFSPIFTLIIGYFLLNSFLGLGDLIGFCFLILGGFVLFFIEKKELKFLSFIFILISSLLFGFSNVLSKVVFQAGPFISGFAWIKIGGVIFVLLLLLYKPFSLRIFSSSRQATTRNRFLYFANRIYAGAGSILVYFAISLTHPALVDASQSFKYVVIFLCAWIFLKEGFGRKILAGKIIATSLIILGILWLGLIAYSQTIPVNPNRNIEWNVTFSAKFSRQLGLDWQKNYEAILNELKPKKVRLVIYWDQTEKERGGFDFSETDWLLEKSREYKTSVILTLGMKVPRWPECHTPEWTQNLTPDEKEEALRQYLKTVVSRYKDNLIIEMWQIENEPFLLFGECPGRSKDFFEKEISTVKSIDSKRPVVSTDSGEFGLWYKAAKEGDIFGTTMYRKVYTKLLGPFLGNIEYPIGPEYFRLKEKIVRFLINDYNKRFIVIELQGEPWSPTELQDRTYEDQMELFSFDYFTDTIKYAKETGFDEYYLWGSEWWYWLKEKHNDSRFWDYAKTIFQPI
ncbi:hypothetical protein AUJ30_02145 [Candidatus Wolfebacteria bacterium CG1_02_39_135]|uniref:Uncharacterized protein n=3 Tax=Candidatus Wolfeibacteriota TaxID=1752735 RepID=A0A2M7Q760_9BACT|nr:DMT family transporter [Candidatus Wolfebacteria bacterium]OIO64645.1 MAG: hypothetical protein AUJ30_02145 [Candidatus Wolfebacteria bacterium CG1_02_39_135]PIY58920.1 MAG: hypothetical protein COY97_01650 [Candidatus Wolfebacteria bacterium CG_4_10_14_0_8_um_filter_39_64]PJB83184.1 MAG: hypothetical protein CO087_02295 [Candidatus Wolfebacteria bacterium CG_4_9_14_0_8_um_filter_39_46]